MLTKLLLVLGLIGAPSFADETVAKPITEKQQRRRDAKLRKELASAYTIWIENDVPYIITQDEKDAFHRLSTDDERQQFVEQFWLRRDPTPDTAENEFKEEHYRRITYANGRFASGIPGWKTDRGRMYIVHGLLTRSSRIPRVAPISNPSRMAAVRSPPFPSKHGAIAGSTACRATSS